MWRKFSQYEQVINEHLEEEYKLNITENIATLIDEHLFSLITTFNIKDLIDRNFFTTIAYAAFKCINQFSQIVPQIVFDHANRVYNICIKEKDRRSIIISIIAAQIIVNMKKGIKEEDYVNYINNLLDMAQTEDSLIANAVYAALQTACSAHQNLCLNKEFFNSILNLIQKSIKSESSYIVYIVLDLLSKIMDPYEMTDSDSNLNGYFQCIIEMLMNASYRQDLMSNFEIERYIYMNVYSLISKLPKSFNDDIILSLGSQILEQYRVLISDHTEISIQLQAWFSIIVDGVCCKLEQKIEPLAVDFFNVLIQTWNEIDSSDLSIKFIIRYFECTWKSN